MSEFEAGQVYEVRYPFVRSEYEDFDADGPHMRKTWKPGVDHRPCGPEDFEAYADAEGAMILTVVSTHKPGRFPERVFFTRRWRDPTGREFGKGKCHIVTAEKFRRLARGFQHGYVVAAAKAA